MKAAALIVVLSACAAGSVGLASDGNDALTTFAVLAILGLATNGLVQILVRRRGSLGSLRRQLLIAVAITAGLVLVTVAAFSKIMLVDGHAALVVSLVTLFAAAVAMIAGRSILEGISTDVEAIRDGLADVGEGNRDVEIVTRGNDELAELAAESNAMIGRVRAEEDARRSLVAAVSHDLRTPLTSLRLLAAAVEDDIVSEQERQQYLKSMRLHIDALGGLIDDLFELSRLESGEVRWKLQRVALGDLVTETVDAMRPHANARGVSMHAADCVTLPAVSADPEKLQRVLFNLIQNAISHTPQDGKITVAGRSDTGAVEIAVSDTGTGIAQQDRAHVFDAFVRGSNNEARTGDGAGLGLAISRAIVESHGGRIWLADAAAGTSIRFSLPRA